MTSSVLRTPQRSKSKASLKTRCVIIGDKHEDLIKPENLLVENDNRITTSKYTLITFIPKNLFEQFRRIANFYFLCIVILQATTNAPVNPATSLTPLIFVVATTAIKQAYEDWLRHKNDNQANRKRVYIFTNDKFEQRACEEIRVGDIVKVLNDEEIPCDMVLLSSSNKESKCHITTANLDGETNLKIRTSIILTEKLEENDVKHFNAMIECENPNTDPHDFAGVIRIFENGIVTESPLGPNNLLLRGARLKNTAFVFGIAVYTGQETKMALNSLLTSNKFTSVERKLNKYLYLFMAILLSTTMIFAVIRMFYLHFGDHDKAWYLDELTSDRRNSNVIIFFHDFLDYFMLYNYLIPISLYVTLELVKFFGSKTLVADENLFGDNFEKPICNTSDLNEELGQVEYLFSDKTGTLTQNIMEFRACIIEDVLFEDIDNKLQMIKEERKLSEITIQTFLLALALCNTVQVHIVSSTKREVQYEYQATSPDEKALVEACQKFGVTLVHSNEKSATVIIGTKKSVYKKLQVFEFDSIRKRMSVIVQDEEGEIFLFCKGSDSILSELVTNGKIDKIFRQVDAYAQSGLRTLVVAYKVISIEEYDKMEYEIHKAAVSLSSQKSELIEIQNEIESNLTIFGATAIEDRLQDEVFETILDLKAAGIKIWVLTGDKLETAISVSYSCALLNSNMIQLILARQQSKESCNELLDQYLNVINNSRASSNNDSDHALIVDGNSLYLAIKYHKEKFRDICEKCAVVLCCRVSPIQKAEVISLMKLSPSNPVTAAIGDGANDVSMLQEAHVGFGIMGKEGRQAVNSSDFAFAKFKFIKRILLVHGHLFYLRVTTLIQYFFYKNVVFVTPQVIYAFFNAYSSQTLYHSMLLMVFNLMLTSGPIVIYALTEKRVPTFILENCPQLYKNISKNSNMSFRMFFLWFFEGVWHGTAAFVGFLFLWGSTSTLFEDGKFGGVYALGLLTYHAVIFIVTFKLLITTHEYDYNYIIIILLTLIILPVYFIIYTNYKWGFIDDELFGLYTPYLFSYSFWLSLFIITFIALLPDIIYTVINNTLTTFNYANLLTEINLKLTNEA